MIEIHNNKLVVRDTSTILRLVSLLTFQVDDNEIFKGYSLKSTDEMVIPKGYLQFLPSDIPRVELGIYDINKVDLSGVDSLLEGITLRDDQVLAVSKMTQAKRGIIQMATGAGKTECMSAFLKNLHKSLGYYPKTLILEPTNHLVNATVKRMKKYGIPAQSYSKCRGRIEGVVVTHPSSLNNDIKKDSSILKDVKVFLTDECHRLTGDTWRALIYHMDTVEYTLGVSASAVYPTRVPVRSLSSLDKDELLIVGATGNVILDIPPSYYISKGILATPILLRVRHAANEYIYKSRNWSSIRKKILESDSRSIKVSQIVSFFSNSGFKSLILVGTKDHAYKLMKYINDMGLGDTCRASFGGGAYYKYDSESKSNVKCSKDEDVLGRYESGELRILIGTSHVYEGMDIPNLDVVVLAGVGQKLRKVVQGVGRALRSSKTGKYAYVVDFTDHENTVLNRHSLERSKVCRTVIGVEDTNIYGNVSVSELKYIVLQLESEHFNKCSNKGENLNDTI